MVAISKSTVKMRSARVKFRYTGRVTYKKAGSLLLSRQRDRNR